MIKIITLSNLYELEILKVTHFHIIPIWLYSTNWITILYRKNHYQMLDEFYYSKLSPLKKITDQKFTY